MTTTSSAGRIPADWLASASINESEGSTVADWLAAAVNAEVSIDEEGSVWVEGAGGGGWLTQEQIDQAIATIDAGI